jgi:hypothetical protein
MIPVETKLAWAELIWHGALAAKQSNDAQFSERMEPRHAGILAPTGHMVKALEQGECEKMPLSCSSALSFRVIRTSGGLASGHHVPTCFFA